DTVNTGLGRFVWDVQYAGGQVVFCTGRRERLRLHTEKVLATGGVPDCVLLCMPNDRTRPIAELKAENLRALGDIDVVAVFDDLLENRIAFTKEFPEALAVAVEIPGWSTERTPGQAVLDGAAVIATFETDPRSRRNAGGFGLSHNHSLAQLNIGRLRSNRLSGRWAAYLTATESRLMVDTIVSDADSAAERTGRAARMRFALDGSGQHECPERTVDALHHVFTRKQFFRGSRADYPCANMRRDVLAFVLRRQPIEVMLRGFPTKYGLNGLKASGPLPDIAELGALARLWELHRAASVVYPPGLRFHVLTDAQHFRRRPVALTGAYRRKLDEYVDLIGIGDHITIEEINDVARRKLGLEVPAARADRIACHCRMLKDALRRFDITDNPLRALARIDAVACGIDGPEGPSLRLFRELLMSMVYSVPIQFPEGTDRLDWSRKVYADVYNLTDHTVCQRVRCGRAEVLRLAWHFTIRYLATMQADQEFGYNELFANRVRLSQRVALPGACGFTFLGGSSGLPPWHGTGVVDASGRLAVDFTVSLLDQGFVPVYSPLLGRRQPWLMAPARCTHWNSDGGGMRLDDAFARTTRLRRR
ncbi:MAG: L-tyrosine/L-tryptophan isonitrile synthase family protein, partial [Mycobacterium sp.]|nr:L-tyrosine/L-tryptophan isonitrile synthase family protein [Mycobacterium sp.]